MKVLVTGHDGYIGSVLTPALERGGPRCGRAGLVAVRRLRPRARRPRGRRRFGATSETSRCDDLGGFDAVVHLAALSNDALGRPRSRGDVRHQPPRPVALARLAKEAGVGRFVFASSCSMYGATGADDVVNESARVNPLTPYAASKVMAEESLHDLADSSFSPTYLRNATAYGFSPRLRSDIVLNNLVAGAHLDGEVRVLSDGTPWRPLVHVEDIASAFLAALEAEREVVHDQAFNVGGRDANLRVREISELVAAAVPGSRVVITGEAGPDPRSYRVDFSKIARLLPGYRPRVSPSAGAAELSEAFGRFTPTRSQFQSLFTRMARLSTLIEQDVVDASLRRRIEPAEDPTSLGAERPTVV